MLDYALAYAAKGWPVFPIHSVHKNTCSCRLKQSCDRKGKHPRISNGRNGATTDPEVIKKWWGVWPDANIGIVTGIESGLIVIDIDQDGDINQADLPDTLSTYTGSGGQHYIYQRPDDDYRYITATNILDNVDSRADGGYIVAPPSTHKSGKSYQWDGDDPSDIDPQPAPQWWLDKIKREQINDGVGEVPKWNPDGHFPANIIEMLSYIPADDYTVWRDVLLALNYTDPVDGFDLADWWSSTSSEYNPDAVRYQWRQMTRAGHDTTNPLTIATIRRMAEHYGYTDPDIEIGSEIANNFLASHQQKIAAKIKAVDKVDQPTELIPRRGLIRELVDDILGSAIRPQPEMALANAIAFVGAIAGQKYRTEFGGRTNVYTIGLLSSGGGKDHSRKRINTIASHAGIDHFMGGEAITSGSALTTAASYNPCKLFQIDEFGYFLQAMTGKHADPNKRDLVAALMKFFSSADSVFRGTEYADQKHKPRVEIYQPNICLYGTSTPSSFWSALSSGQSVDGSLARFLVFQAEHHRPPRQQPNLSKPSQSVVDKVRDLANYVPKGAGNLHGIASNVDTVQPQTVAMTDEVKEDFGLLDDAMTERMTDDARAAIYSRVAEHASKLALIYAVSVNHESPKINMETWAWAREIALYNANTLAHEIDKHLADTPFEAACKEALAAIQKNGDRGATLREISRAAPAVRSMPPYQREQVIKALETDYGVVHTCVDDSSKRGRKRYAYVQLS